MSWPCGYSFARSQSGHAERMASSVATRDLKSSFSSTLPKCLNTYASALARCSHKCFNGAKTSWDALFEKAEKAPWIPKLKSDTDTSLFDPYEVDDTVDTSYVDSGNWDADF